MEFEVFYSIRQIFKRYFSMKKRILELGNSLNRMSQNYMGIWKECGLSLKENTHALSNVLAN
jgi:hypothetical protein